MSLGRAVLAYPAMLRTGFAGAIAYRAEMVVWMLTMTMPLVSLSLWSAVAANGPVAGFTQERFAAHFIAVLLVRQLTSSWLVWELNQEIKNGGLAQKLLRPVHPLWYYSAENLGALPLRVVLCVPLVVLSATLLGAFPLPRAPLSILAFAAAIVGAWLINFFTMALVGALAFFVESSAAVFDVYLLGFMIFSGYIVPLELFPPGARAIADVLPFRYSLAFPVQIATGAVSGAELLRPFAIQWAFVLGLATAALLVFRAGVRRFGAFGG